MLARLDGFNAKSGRTRRKRYERRDDETRRCAAGRRFLFVAPFSVAHPCRQEKGIRLLFFSFAPSCLLPALSCPYHPVVSYRLRPVEALRGGRRGVGRYASAGRWRDLASRFSSRPIVSLCGSFDFPRIGLRAGGGVRRFCQLILLRHSLAAGRIVFLFVSSLRLACSSRVASRAILCDSLANPFYLVDLPVSRCPVSPGGSSLVPPSCSSFLGVLSCQAYRLPSSRPASCQAVRVLVSSGGLFRRLVGRVGFSLSPVSFSSVLVSFHSLRLMAMATAARLALALWLRVSFPVAIRHRGAVAIAEMGVPFGDTRGRAVLFSSFPHQGGE